MTQTVRVSLLITGKVQGVGFRAATQAQGRLQGLVGWVRNTPEGDVECVAEGPAPEIEAFTQWCHEGPPSADVSSVTVLEKVETNGLSFRSFEIRRG